MSVQLTQQQQEQLDNLSKGMQVLQEDFTRFLISIGGGDTSAVASEVVAGLARERSAYFPKGVSSPEAIKSWLERSGLKMSAGGHPEATGDVDPALALPLLKAAGVKSFDQLPPALRSPAALKRLNDTVVGTLNEIVAEHEAEQKMQAQFEGGAAQKAAPPTVTPPAAAPAPASSAPAPSTVKPVTEQPKGSTPEEIAAQEAAILEEDSANLQRVIQNAFSTAIHSNFRGTYQWQPDHKDNFDADIFAQSKPTICEWPEGFYRSDANKSPQYRGQIGNFIYLLDFNAAEKCYIVFTNIADGLIAPWSSFGGEHRRQFTKFIFDDLKTKVIPKNATKPPHGSEAH